MMSVSLELSGRAGDVGKILAKVRSKKSLNVEQFLKSKLGWLMHHVTNAIMMPSW